MKIIDSVMIGDARVTSDGYLEANAHTARTGIQQYLGREIGRPDLDVVNVYRDEAEVFAKRSLDTFSRLPLTIGHPANGVNANNWRDLAVGTTGDEVLRDGEYLKIGLKITDGQAVQAVQNGKRELSVGYTADIVWQDGIAPDGTAYQAVQRNIAANHIAIVDKGRAGSRARIGDSWEDFQPGGKPKTVRGQTMTDQLKTVVLGESAVQVAIADVAAIEKYKQGFADAQAAHADAIAAKDEEIGQLRADLKVAKDAAMIDVDALVAARSELVAQVKAIDSAIEVAGKTDADLRRAAVASKLGDDMVKDASDAEIVGMFKAVTKQHNAVADALKQQPATSKIDDAHADYVARLTRQQKGK